LGFVPRGEAGAFIAERNTAPTGKPPLSTNGGGVSALPPLHVDLNVPTQIIDPFQTYSKVGFGEGSARPPARKRHPVIGRSSCRGHDASSRCVRRVNGALGRP
jgi:hypothetical protein